MHDEKFRSKYWFHKRFNYNISYLLNQITKTKTSLMDVMIEESHDNLVFALGLIEEIENKATALKELSYWYMDKLNDEEVALKESDESNDEDETDDSKTKWNDFFESFVGVKNETKGVKNKTKKEEGD